MLRRHRPPAGPLPAVKRRPTTNPILPVADMAAAIACYERLGFEVNAYDDAYAWVTHGGWEWAHLRLVESVEGNECSAYFHVDDAAAWHAAITNAAASSTAIEVEALTETPWGKLEFAFIDPAGNRVRIGSPS